MAVVDQFGNVRGLENLKVVDASIMPDCIPREHERYIDGDWRARCGFHWRRAMTAQFTLSAFGDEIAEDVDEQLRVLHDLNIGYLELRSAWGTNVLELTDEQVGRLIERCDAHSIRVSCIGSPIGKSPIDGPIEEVVDDLGRITDIAKMVGTDRVRVFSFYPESDGLQAERVEESMTRLRMMAEVAVERNVMLLLENEGAWSAIRLSGVAHSSRE